MGGTGGGDDEKGFERPFPGSLPLSDAWNIEPDCECCERADEYSLDRKLRPLRASAGVDGRKCGGLAPEFSVPAREGACGGGAYARAEFERLNGFLSAGYACGSSTGTGGGTSACLVLLNAFRRDAKDDFFVKGELLVVATDDWVECVKGALGALRGIVCTD